MTTSYHTDITTGAAANAAIVNAPLGELDDAIADVWARIGTAAGSSGTLGTAIDTDGTLKAGAVDNAAVLGAEVVTGAKIDGGALTTPNLIWDALNHPAAPVVVGTDWGGKARWYGASNLSYVYPDSANPYGGNATAGAARTLRVGTALAYGGKYIYCHDVGIAAGDTITAAARLLSPAGTDCYLVLRFFDKDYALLGLNAYSAKITGSAEVQSSGPVSSIAPADAYGFLIFLTRTAGSGNIDIYALWATRSAFISDIPTAATGADAWLPYRALEEAGPNLLWDAYNEDQTPATDANRWYQDGLLSIIDPDAANPWGGRTLRFSAAGTTGGKVLQFADVGLKEGDQLFATAQCMAADGETYHIAIWCRTALHATTGSQAYSAIATGTGLPQTLTTGVLTIPAGTTEVLFFVYQESGSHDIDIYATSIQQLTGTATRTQTPPSGNLTAWCDEITTARGSAADLDTRLSVSLADDGSLLTSAITFPAVADTYGRCYLKDWQMALARMLTASSGYTTPRVAVLGDSWSVLLYTELRPVLQAVYGGSAYGYVNFVEGLAAGATVATAGTWTAVDGSTSDTARGVNISHVVSTDYATPAYKTVTSAVHAFKIHYMQQVNGGSFRWKVDSGSWTTVDTAAGAEAFAHVDIAELDGNSHVLTIELTGSGTAGVLLCGVECNQTGAGVICHAIGNNGSKTGHWTAVDETLWQNALAELAPHLIIIHGHVNDIMASAPAVTPAAYAANLTEIIARCRAAVATADILLIAPGDPEGTYTYTVQEYVNEIRALAVSLNCACIDSYLNLGDYAAANARDAYDPAHHLGEGGRRLVANLITRFIAAY